MSIITMDQIACMSVQYVHYSFEYYLNSMQRLNVRNLDLWGGHPHYCPLDYLTRSESSKRVREIRNMVEANGQKIVINTTSVLLAKLFAIVPWTILTKQSMRH